MRTELTELAELKREEEGFLVEGEEDAMAGFKRVFAAIEEFFNRFTLKPELYLNRLVLPSL